MIVVDTSAWINATRRPEGEEANVLRALIEADEAALALPVRLELMSGIARKDRATFGRALTALPVISPTDDTWRLLESWIAPAADAGYRFAVSDLLIAALAHEIGGLVWSADADFERMETAGLVKLYAPA